MLKFVTKLQREVVHEQSTVELTVINKRLLTKSKGAVYACITSFTLSSVFSSALVHMTYSSVNENYLNTNTV